MVPPLGRTNIKGEQRAEHGPREQDDRKLDAVRNERAGRGNNNHARGTENAPTKQLAYSETKPGKKAPSRPIAFNNGQKRVAYSMDVKALYPSITAAQAGEAVKTAMETTSLTFANVNYPMALRYIAKSAESDDQVKEWGFADYCPIRTRKPGVRPGMVGDADADEKWTDGSVPLDGQTRRKILGKVLELAVMKVFKSNVYRFGGKTYLQTDGAPIGLDLSGEIGCLVMALWDVSFMSLCEEKNIVVDLK